MPFAPGFEDFPHRVVRRQPETDFPVENILCRLNIDGACGETQTKQGAQTQAGTRKRTRIWFM
jgi:hypothetical protein